MATMMKCGHQANALTSDGKPSCVICVGIDEGATIVDENPPSLEGRKARCSMCGKEAESANQRLAFFEYRGPGSHAAETTCKCGYHKRAHEPSRYGDAKIDDHEFESRGAFDFDLYYCGCRGWD